MVVVEEEGLCCLFATEMLMIAVPELVGAFTLSFLALARFVDPSELRRAREECEEPTAGVMLVVSEGKRKEKGTNFVKVD